MAFVRRHYSRRTAQIWLRSNRKPRSDQIEAARLTAHTQSSCAHLLIDRLLGAPLPPCRSERRHLDLLQLRQ